MKIRRIGLILAALLLAFLAASLATGQKNDQAEVALKAATNKELVDGDLKGAIELYKKIVASYGKNRTVIAHALVQMGQCYEKLGKTEARNAYERVVREFADQPEPARLARQRLAALQQPTSPAKFPEMAVRRVMSVPEGAYGLLSPGGNYLSFTDWETGDLAIRELTADKKRRLTNKGSWSDSPEYTLYSAPSRDGRKVAYDWHTRDDFMDLRVIGLDGSGPQVLYHSKEVAGIYPCDWSPDGDYILAVFTLNEDYTNQIALVSAKDGSVRVLKTLGRGISPIQRMNFSPDGRYVAYDYRSQGDSLNHDIFLLAADGSREVPLVQHPAHDLLLGWAPDGKRILFSSDRTGTTDVWMLLVADGKPQGSPELIKKDMGRISPLGFARNGSYFYAREIGGRDVYVASVDRATGKVLAPPAAIPQRFVGSNRTPDWSPDGKRLLYISRRSLMGPGFNMPSIRWMETGEERDLSPKLNFLDHARWSPDGRSILAECTDRSERSGICRIDAQTGATTLLVENKSGENRLMPAGHPDGKHVLYSYKWQTIRMLNLETGEERDIVRSADMHFALSLDGRQLVFNMSDEATKEQVLKAMPLAGGEARELFRAKKLGGFWPSWTPDGRQVLVGEADDQNEGLWLIPVEGGKPLKLTLGIKGIRGPRFHPDGRQLAFWVEPPDLKSEIWVMENLVPPQEARKTEMTVRRVWGGDILGAPTRDGRYLTFSDESENLAVYDIATGQKRLLTNKDPRSFEFVLLSVPSPDGKQVAYGWYNKDEFCDLRIVGLDGSNPRVLYAGARLSELYPADWSPDGKNILAIFRQKGKPTQLALVSVGDGSVRVLKIFDRESPHRARFSPDGRYIAYDFPQRYGSYERDIFVLAVDGGREIPLVQHPAHDLIFDWTPDGNRVLFGSDRSGTMGAWWIQIADGKAIGTPALVKADLGRDIRPMGFAQNGSYYYGVNTQMSDVYIAELDLATGKLLAEPIPATQRFTGSNSRPEWSDDGRQLLFLSARGPGVWGAKAFCIRSTETGEVRELASKLNQVGWVRWSPDGRYLLGPASIDNTFLLCRIDVQTGEFERVDLQRVMGLAPEWSRDSRAIYYYRWSTNKTTDIVFRDLATGQEKILHSVADPSTYYAGAALSRDGKHLAFVVTESGESGPRVLQVMPAAGGETRELLREDRPLMRRPVVWAPDGQSLLFTRQPAGNAKAELWLISVQGGAPRKLDLAAEGMREPSIHPDGRHIAYTAGRNISEVWVMENFLPAAK